MLSGDAPPTVALIGDSHAGHLFAGLQQYYRQRDENLLDMESCMILKDVESIQDGTPQPTCPIYRDAILSYVSQTASIKTVVLSFRGPLSVTGAGYWPVGDWSDQEPRSRQLVEAGRPGLKDNEAIFAGGLRSTLSMLVELRKQVIFVFDNPELGFEPIACEERPLKLPGTETRSPCAIERRAFDGRSSSYIALVKSVLKDFPMVKTFSPASVLCDEAYCYAAKDGVLLYMDDDHFTYQGSLLIGRNFAPS
jgi:hypothetical protein